jgi:hypothetical protein
MSRFYRLSITELASTLEVVVELPDDLLEGESEEVLKQELNAAAAEAVAKKWRTVNPGRPDPPVLPSHFEIEPLPTFDPSTVAFGYGPFRSSIGAWAWITRAPSGLVF